MYQMALYFSKEIRKIKEIVFSFVTSWHLKIVKAGSIYGHTLFYIKMSKNNIADNKLVLLKFLNEI